MRHMDKKRLYLQTCPQPAGDVKDSANSSAACIVIVNNDITA